VANPDLPRAGAKRKHLLRNLTHGRNDQAPGPLCSGIGRTAGMLIRRDDDPATGTCVDIDMWVDAALADEPQGVEALEQRFSDLRTLANQHQNLSVLKTRCECVDILDMIVPDRHLVSVQLAKAPEGTKRVEIVIENRNLHGIVD